MGRSVAVAFIVISLWSTAKCEPYVCQESDCNLYDTPSDKNRVCKVSDAFDYLELEWYTGTLDDRTCHNSVTGVSQDVSEVCPGYVGMTMSLWCDFVNVTSVIYKNGMPLTGDSTVTFDRLQKKDEGLYQCRQYYDSGEVIIEFNMTVQGELYEQ